MYLSFVSPSPSFVRRSSGKRRKGSPTTIGCIGLGQDMVMLNNHVPGHRGSAGNEAADAYVRDAAGQTIPDKDSRLAAERISAPFLKRRAAERATRRWKEIRRPGAGGREPFSFRGPNPNRRLDPPPGPNLEPSPGALPAAERTRHDNPLLKR